MKQQILAVILLSASAALAQQPGGRGGRGAAPPPPVLVLKETWKQAPGNVPVTQDFVTNASLQLNLYPGTNKEDFGVTSEGNVPHIWTGLCSSSCALTLSDKDNYLDLTGKARIRWYTKVSGFHEVRPVLKLADGTFLMGDHVDANALDYLESEFYLSEVHWLKVDMPKVQTKGTLLEKVDLSKVDAVGFADLTPGSGHGSGGYSDVAWIEVYGKAVKRDIQSASK